MTNDLQIHIPTPCHENWNAMTPEAKGRFCGSCAKVVVDFSVMTDNEVLNYLKKNSSNTCGHFTSDQLDRPIIETQLQPNKTWRYWLAFITSLLVMLKQSNGQSQRNTNKLIGDTTIVTNDFKDIIVGKVAIKPNEKKVVGRVVDEHDKPILGASVIIKNTRTGVATDADGKFSFKVNTDKVTVSVSCIGYTTKEFEVAANEEIKLIKLAMNEFSIMGEVILVRPPKKRKSQIEKKPLIDTLAQCVSKVIDGKAFTVYPNPVSANGVINIVIKEAGIYDIQILDNQSRLLRARTLNTQASKQSIKLNLPSGVSQGINYLRLVNTLTNKQWIDKIVVQ
ncbi:carboxypeptidase-like regulatory domain-containing protein [Parasediminibacterium paludis]|uniref:Carboxypeptidase-like regulatory domain-containing protein n=1 Tax=Parasediminibacterium paludis TaxID=908966 RepID=A0ABV8PUC1_9BACT